MNCRDIDKLCTAYVDGGLDDNRASALRGHLRTCARCGTSNKNWRSNICTTYGQFYFNCIVVTDWPMGIFTFIIIGYRSRTVRSINIGQSTTTFYIDCF